MYLVGFFQYSASIVFIDKRSFKNIIIKTLNKGCCLLRVMQNFISALERPTWKVWVFSTFVVNWPWLWGVKPILPYRLGPCSVCPAQWALLKKAQDVVLPQMRARALIPMFFVSQKTSWIKQVSKHGRSWVITMDSEEPLMQSSDSKYIWK